MPETVDGQPAVPVPGRCPVTGRLAVMLVHLLKWRRRAERLLTQNPSLRTSLDAVMTGAYADAMLMGERETVLPEDSFPATCPWTFDQAMQDDLT